MAYGEQGIVHDLSGYQVYDRHYEKIGKVDDIFVDENDRPEYIGVKMGFLGTKSTLIPIEIVRVNDRRQLVEVAADKDAIKEGPTFGDDRDITPEFERRVLDYYGVGAGQPFAERGSYGAYYPDATGDGRVDLQPGERAADQHSGIAGRTDERRSDERYPEERRTDERRVGERHADERHSGERRTDERRPDERRTGIAASGVDRGGDVEDEVRVQRSEEELRVGTRERQAGGVSVRKRVRTDREQVTVPKRREEVRVERVPAEERGVSGSGEQGVSGVEVGEDEIRIPIIEEEVVVEKRPVVKEEIRIRKDLIEEEEVVEADVRKEEIDIDDQTTRRDR